MIEKEIKFGALRKVITDNEFKFWNYWQLLLGIHHVQVFYTRGGSEQSEVSETGRAGNRNWLKSRNSEIKIFSEIGSD